MTDNWKEPIHWPDARTKNATKVVTHVPRQRPAMDTTGPGTFLSHYLKTFKVAINEGCGSCTYHRDKMNEWGPEECLNRIDTIVRWLKIEAFKRHLPFNAFAAKKLIEFCCRKSRIAIDEANSNRSNG